MKKRLKSCFDGSCITDLDRAVAIDVVRGVIRQRLHGAFVSHDVAMAIVDGFLNGVSYERKTTDAIKEEMRKQYDDRISYINKNRKKECLELPITTSTGFKKV